MAIQKEGGNRFKVSEECHPCEDTSYVVVVLDSRYTSTEDATA